ncbi:RpiB/LacA/LacB family sugar-phosphate isomerase [Candidatus Saccharibacteria bacterium]|nr:RpiB/LacA/LacB family sugar-phosphate isomerase [Candidatus Saccharibacteria bacterium]
MNIYIGADHHGHILRQYIADYLRELDHHVYDQSNHKLDPEDDYPIFASRVAKNILSNNDLNARGILLCGSGQGIMIAANRYKGIRACLGYNIQTVQAARNDDDCNVLVLPADYLKQEQVKQIIDAFLNTDFIPNERYIRRIKQIDELT